MPAPEFLPRTALTQLLAVLTQAGYRCVGPQVRDGAIVYDNLRDVQDLPRGVHDRQAPGVYRIETSASPRCFAWATGPQALKPLLFAPQETLWRAERDVQGGLRFVETAPVTEALAVIGVRACDLAALRLHDQHFLAGTHPDPAYRARRASLLLVAVHCTHPADTCFCASTGDGPRATHSFDLALSELDDGFLVQAGSDAGQRSAAWEQRGDASAGRAGSRTSNACPRT